MLFDSFSRPCFRYRHDWESLLNLININTIPCYLAFSLSSIMLLRYDSISFCGGCKFNISFFMFQYHTYPTPP